MNLTQNIIGVWNQATPEHIRIGRQWYAVAHLEALRVSGGDVVKGAGVIAALSPMKTWAMNIQLAERAFSDGPSGHFADAIQKVHRILDGQDPSEVLPSGSKTWNFYHCILDPLGSAVCIDRHAHDIAMGSRYGERDRRLGKPKVYATVAQAYRDASDILSEMPSVVQAVTWGVWRGSYD